MAKSGWVHHSTGSSGVFPISISQTGVSAMGTSLAAEKPAKAASKDSWRLGKKKEGKGKRRKTPFCKDAERTEVALLKEEMNGRMSDNGAESPKWKGEKEVTAMEKHSPTQQAALPTH